MAGLKTVDFYQGKPASLPRFVYRRLAQSLKSGSPGRSEAIAAALRELLTGSNPDLRKFRFFLPDFLRTALAPQEAEQMARELSSRRAHASQLKAIYPHVSDEFSLDPDFLASVLDLDGGPEVAPACRFFTIGSCFARNIAEFLVMNGRDARTFGLAEDLNSPISNAFIFDLLSRPPAARREVLGHWLRRIFPDAAEADMQRGLTAKLAEMEQLAGQLGQADCVVLTLGNIVDFFQAAAPCSARLMDKVVPKFVAMPASEDVRLRSGAAMRLKSCGATLRLATHAETSEAISLCIAGIRSITAAPIVVTLSPVPVDSVIGLAGTDMKSAIEVDCVSKARLRSAFEELSGELRAAHAPIHYFPSFEIVRWIGPMLAIPTFGLDDAASRHVSSPILEAVCTVFLQKFLRQSGP